MSFGSYLLLKDKKRKEDYSQTRLLSMSNSRWHLTYQLLSQDSNLHFCSKLNFFFGTYIFFCCDSWTHSWAKYNSVHTALSNFVACLHSKAFPFWFLCKIVLKQEKNSLENCLFCLLKKKYLNFPQSNFACI